MSKLNTCKYFYKEESEHKIFKQKSKLGMNCCEGAYMNLMDHCHTHHPLTQSYYHPHVNPCKNEAKTISKLIHR